jgi:hypothetical protein
MIMTIRLTHHIRDQANKKRHTWVSIIPEK